MMRSLFSGVAGLKNHQTRMDVIGNNIANVNTTGFKASRVNFQDILSQTMQGASSAQGNRGGTNPMQVGLGMGVASIDTLFTDGSYQTTGKQTDLSITGQGFFIVTDGTNKYYTRAGNFDFDAQGNYLVPGTGLKVAGWMADADGVINSSGDIGSIQIPVGDTMAAKATTSYDFINNLSDDAEIGKIVQASTIVYDSKGNGHSVDTNFIKVADNKWIYSVEVPDALAAPAPENLLGEITFGSDGQTPQVKQIDPTSMTPLPTAATGITLTTLDSTSKSVNSVSSLVWDANKVPHIITTTFTNTGTDKWSYNIVEAGTTKSLGKGTIKYDSATSAYTYDPPYDADPADPTNPTDPTKPASPIASFDIAGNPVTLTLDVASITAPGVFNAVPAPLPDGTYTATTTAKDVAFTPKGGADPMTVTMNFDKLTQYAGESTLQAVNGDGYPAGTLDMSKLTIDQSGIITATFTNGKSKSLGQVASAVFNNPGGLTKAGENLYATSNNSGDPQIGTGGSGGRGTFRAGSLEMSNVDLAQQFSDMIITQRGFQANSKIITTTDEMLELLANLKR